MKQLIDITKLKVDWIDGTTKELDFAKDLAQVIFNKTQDIKEHTFAIDLYKTGKFELNKGNKEIIMKYVDSYFLAYVKLAITELFKDIE